MHLSLRPIDYQSVSDLNLLVKWFNDPELRSMYMGRKDEAHIPPLETIESIKNHRLNRDPAFEPLGEWMIIADQVPVGEVSLILNPPHKRSRGEKVVWPSIAIGEKSYLRKGIATWVIGQILLEGKKVSATHVEAGIYEFNLPMRKLIQKIGFKEIARIENFTWFEGRKWADVRYEMALNELPLAL
jgi:RimJ/RimL family protein N-acetyltransferase